MDVLWFIWPAKIQSIFWSIFLKNKKINKKTKQKQDVSKWRLLLRNFDLNVFNVVFDFRE